MSFVFHFFDFTKLKQSIKSGFDSVTKVYGSPTALLITTRQYLPIQLELGHPAYVVALFIANAIPIWLAPVPRPVLSRYMTT